MHTTSQEPGHMRIFLLACRLHFCSESDSEHFRGYFGFLRTQRAGMPLCTRSSGPRRCPVPPCLVIFLACGKVTFGTPDIAMSWRTMYMGEHGTRRQPFSVGKAVTSADTVPSYPRETRAKQGTWSQLAEVCGQPSEAVDPE